jgi:DNA-binding transcriptional LysR family regulator
MDTESLKAFIAVAETSSFSIAAERLFITQPAVSKRIANLEELLASKLFDRIGRATLLTESGQTLLPRAKRILQEIEDGRREINELSGDVSGKFSLGISHHIGLHRLPPVLKQFYQQFPKVQYDIQYLDSEVAYEEVYLGHIELALITLAPKNSQSKNTKVELISKTIWNDPLYFVVSPEHPLAAQNAVSLKQLSVHGALLPDNSTYTGLLVNTLFESRKLQIQANSSTNYLESIKMMVSIGLGWSVLPASMIDKQLKVLDVPYIELSRQLGYIRHPARSLSNAGKAFIELLHQHRIK